MQQQIFSIPAFDSQSTTDEMNRFIRSHKIVKIERHFVAAPEGSYWTFCIQYVDGAPQNTFSFNRKDKPDYSTVLSVEHFKIFNQLRKHRKVIADSDGVPAYAVFSDEELANITVLTEINTKNMMTIKGIGLKKVEKYGAAMVDMYKTQPNETPSKLN